MAEARTTEEGDLGRPVATARMLITGAGGFIGRALRRAAPDARHADHRALLEHPGLLDGMAVLIHAGRDPHLGSDRWRLEEDVETRLARLAAARGIRHVMLSSRKVHGLVSAPIDAATPVAPCDLYGRQKAAIEAVLGGLVGPGAILLRLSNIFGCEPGRASFMGAMLDGLANRGEIRFDMSPATIRDFLPVDAAAAAILTVAARAPGGRVTLGSGVPLATGDFAAALIEGFGAGRLVVTDDRVRDSFLVDPAGLRAWGVRLPDREAILARARDVGAAWRRAQQRR